MLPPQEVSQHFVSKEQPAPYPSGPNTSFHNLTPMPYRFTEDALPVLNEHHAPEKVKEQSACYHTTSSEIGRLPMEGTDFPMRWYGRAGTFTSGWVAEPKTKVNTGLNTGMDRSDIHQTCALTRKASHDQRCSIRSSLRHALTSSYDSLSPLNPLPVLRLIPQHLFAVTLPQV